MARLPVRTQKSNSKKPSSYKPLIEALEDRYVMDAYGLSLDFGTPLSPVDKGYQQFGVGGYDSSKDAVSSYGWTNSKRVEAFDTRIGTDLTRDGVRGQINTFVAEVPNGKYQISALLGSSQSFNDRITIYSNDGIEVNNLTNYRQRFVPINFTTEVKDGLFRMTFVDAGGQYRYFSLASLQITAVATNPGTPTLTVSAGSNQTGNEGASFLFGGQVSGGVGPYQYNWNFSDGTQTSGSLTPSKTFADNGQYQVTLSVTDANNTTKTSTLSVTVNNVAPTSSFTSSGAVTLGNPATVQFSGQTDPSVSDVAAGFRYSYDFNNDGTFEVTNSTSSSAVVPASYFTAAGNYAVKGRIADKDGGFTDYTTSVVVNAPSDTTPPTATLVTPTANSTLTGTVSFSATASDNVGVTGVQYFLNSQAISPVLTNTGYTFSWNSASVSNGSYTVKAVARDAAGNLGESTLVPVTILNNNTAPTVIFLSNSSVAVSANIGTVIGFFSTNDPDLGETFTYELVAGTGGVDNGKFRIQGNSLVLNQTIVAGNYSIRMRVIDSANHALENVFAINAVTQSALLLNKSNLEYVGGFRVPNYYNGTDEFSYSNTALAFNAASNSLFVSGHYNSIAEISIPTSIVNSTQLSNLSTASILQPWTSVIPRLTNQLANAWDGAPLGGLMVHNGKLIGTQYAYYSGAHEQNRSHFIVDSLNLSTANVQGLFKVGTMARHVAGYMAPIPTEWQSLLGATHLTGQADVPIINSTSSGPAVFGFNAGSANDVDATPFVYYPVDRPLGAYEGPANPIQNGNTSVTGVVFVPNSSTVLFFGKTATNYSGYGTAQEFNDPYDGGKGPHSLNGEYASQVWAYDANDFVLVKNGQKQPWDVRPYNVWNFNVPVSHGQQGIGGVTFDPATNRIYFASINSDTVASYSSLPIIQVFQLNYGATQSKPQVGTLAATPFGALPGAVLIGTQMTLTAGNVYGLSPAEPVSSVKFYIDSNNNNSWDVTDEVLGNGYITPTTKNWTLTISTAGMQSGIRRIFAKAFDDSSLSSDSITATFQLL